MEKTTTPVMRLVPTVWAAITHLLLLAAAIALFLGRKPGVFRSQAIIDMVPGFYSHVFNFSLSWIFLAGIGYLWLMMGVTVRHLLIAGLVLILANLAYEFLLPVLNTRDPVDALYGIVGTVLALAWLWIVRRYGLRPAPQKH